MHVEPAVGIRDRWTPGTVSCFTHEAVTAIPRHVEGHVGFPDLEGFVDVEVAVA